MLAFSLHPLPTDSDASISCSLTRREKMLQVSFAVACQGPLKDATPATKLGAFTDELWRIDLRRDGKLKVATLLEKPDSLRTDEFASSASFENGRWTARVTRPISPEAPLRTVSDTQRYTFGIALHGKERKGSEHWVSLPMTLSMDRDDTDFITR